MARVFRVFAGNRNTLGKIKSQQAAIYKRRLWVRDINADTGKMNMVHCSCLTTNSIWPTDAFEEQKLVKIGRGPGC